MWHQVVFTNDTIRHSFSAAVQGEFFTIGTNRVPVMKIGPESIWIDLGYPPMHLGHELTHLVHQIRLTTLNRADLVAIVPAKMPGFSITSNGNGIIAILIGLLLPAVQKVREASARNRLLLDLILKPGGETVMPAHHHTGGRFMLDIMGSNAGF